MTYKSFQTTLDEHDDAGRLVRFPVFFDPDETDIRELWMPPALVQTLSQNDPKKRMEYNANIRGFLGRFIKGDEIDNCQYMKCWKEDVFEFRVQNQARKDNLRIFGAFGVQNKFVAFFRRPRSDFGGRHDPAWDRAIDRATTEWGNYFPGVHRMRARPFSNCVTNGVDIPAGEC